MTQPKLRKASKFRRWFEVILLFAGVLGLSAWLVSIALPIIWQDWENWVFDHELLGQQASITGYLSAREEQIVNDLSGWLGLSPPVEPFAPAAPITPPRAATTHRPPAKLSPLSLPPNVLVGRLAIPRLHLSAIVREGVGEGTLGLAVGHIPGTALPGQNGNVAVAGHRDTLFRGLGDIRNNDLIQLETLEGNYLYEVASTEIVKPRNVSVLKAGQYPELTLVTCYPFNYIGSAP